MKPSLICIIFTSLLPQMAYGAEKRQLEFHFPQQQHQQHQQQFYGEIIDNRDQQQQTVKLLPQSYPIQGIPIHRYDYFDADETAISGVEEQNPIVSGVNFFKDEGLYPRTALVDFSMWTEWSFCSRSCGGGVSMRSRDCVSQISNTPECDEDQLFQYMICNIKPCPNANEDYRAIQCAEYNNTQKFGGIFQNFSWVPYYGSAPDAKPEPCELRCMAIGYVFWKSFGPARDGTRCSQDRYDMCVGGKCMRVGCDRILGSNRTEDTCGVCGGDNSSCRVVRREFTQTKNLMKSDYNEIEMIPKGATNIRVRETTGNYLALMEANGEFVNYVINGNWVISYPGDILAAGTMVRYERDGENESFFALGPTNTDLYIMMLYLGGKPNIEIEYWRSNNDLSQLREFRRRFKIVPNEANFKTMPFIEPYSPPTTTAVPPPQVVPVTPAVRTTAPTPTTTTTTTTTTTRRPPVTTTTTRRIPPYTPTWSHHNNRPKPPQHNRPHNNNHHHQQQSRQPELLPIVAPLPVIAASPIAKVDRNKGKPPYCRPCKKTVGRKRHFCDSDFVIYVQILSKTRMEGKRYRHDVLVRKVYKSGFKLMSREYIWVYSSCCPRLRRGREYLIMGRKRRIKFNPGSRGSWITSEKKLSDGVQFQTRLVLDYLDYWRTWKSRYDGKMSSLSQHQREQCSKFKTTTTSKPKSRDPEKRSTPV